MAGLILHASSCLGAARGLCPAVTLLCVLFLVCAPAAAAAGVAGPRRTQAAARGERITTASGARVRAAPRLDAEEVARLPLGVVVRELERTEGRESVGGQEDYWYRVAAAGGAEGWVFGGLTAPFDPARREAIYMQLAGARSQLPEASFAESVELFRFLDRAVREVTRPEKLAELELERLLALQKSLAAVPIDRQQESPYKEWLEEQEPRIVYSEPAGRWYVRSEQLWGLERKHRGLRAAERIAWEAARMPLPGECEGYLPCHIQLELLTNGAYLRLYPRGLNADKAFRELAAFIREVAADAQRRDPVFQVPREDRAEFQKSLAELRSIIARVPAGAQVMTLRRIGEIARRFR